MENARCWRKSLMDIFSKDEALLSVARSSDNLESTGEQLRTSVRGRSGQRSSIVRGHFPKLADCAHFHYEYVDFRTVQLSLAAQQTETYGNGLTIKDLRFLVKILCQGKEWLVHRSWDDFRMLDSHLHQCIYDRRFSQLPELVPLQDRIGDVESITSELMGYLIRLSNIADNRINCGPVLTWMEIDNKGNRLLVNNETFINIPAIAAAQVIKRYTAQARDELSFEVGDIVSVIDMPPKQETTWWRGKRSFQVGFFPSECVQLISERAPATNSTALVKPDSEGVVVNPGTRSAMVGMPVRELSPRSGPRRQGSLMGYLLAFMKSRPSRQRLKQQGILRERVFGCDLGEHLLNSGLEVPQVLKSCSEFIENHGIVDGIYRLSGISSNIQKLRTLHFLMRHLEVLAKHSLSTGMHVRNLAIVWAPNLLRSSDIETVGFSGTDAFREVRIQSIVVEFLLSHVNVLFSDSFSSAGWDIHGSTDRSRNKPLPAGGSRAPLHFLPDPQARGLLHRTRPSSVNRGPCSQRPPVQRNRNAGKGRKTGTGSWKSFFTIGKAASGTARDSQPEMGRLFHVSERGMGYGNVYRTLRSVKSEESLSSQTETTEFPRHHSLRHLSNAGQLPDRGRAGSSVPSHQRPCSVPSDHPDGLTNPQHLPRHPGIGRRGSDGSRLLPWASAGASRGPADVHPNLEVNRQDMMVAGGPEVKGQAGSQSTVEPLHGKEGEIPTEGMLGRNPTAHHFMSSPPPLSPPTPPRSPLPPPLSPPPPPPQHPPPPPPPLHPPPPPPPKDPARIMALALSTEAQHVSRHRHEFGRCSPDPESEQERGESRFHGSVQKVHPSVSISHPEQGLGYGSEVTQAKVLGPPLIPDPSCDPPRPLCRFRRSAHPSLTRDPRPDPGRPSPFPRGGSLSRGPLPPASAHLLVPTPLLGRVPGSPPPRRSPPSPEPSCPSLPLPSSFVPPEPPSPFVTPEPPSPFVPPEPPSPFVPPEPPSPFVPPEPPSPFVPPETPSPFVPPEPPSPFVPPEPPSPGHRSRPKLLPPPRLDRVRRAPPPGPENPIRPRPPPESAAPPRERPLSRREVFHPPPWALGLPPGGGWSRRWVHPPPCPLHRHFRPSALYPGLPERAIAVAQHYGIGPIRGLPPAPHLSQPPLTMLPRHWASQRPERTFC
ncbi:rho GTPase-activating protein 33-like isoform X2 [Narcine bancroftii]|uniref:rho GTPase-activating protein 33-like isoform X2 n=1 Tax=Narcine bancroftii TaxID=1343680 RepID=UPI003831D0AD